MTYVIYDFSMGKNYPFKHALRGLYLAYMIYGVSLAHGSLSFARHFKADEIVIKKYWIQSPLKKNVFGISKHMGVLSDTKCHFPFSPLLYSQNIYFACWYVLIYLSFSQYHHMLYRSGLRFFMQMHFCQTIKSLLSTINCTWYSHDKPFGGSVMLLCRPSVKFCRTYHTYPAVACSFYERFMTSAQSCTLFK